MQKIIPHFWFDKQAVEAARFYEAVFQDCKILTSSVIKDTPSGDAEVVSFRIGDFVFAAISAGPQFKINPSISFLLNFDPSLDQNAEDNLAKLWGELIKDAQILMPLDSYPFSKKYGWVQDKFGVSWQLMLTNPHDEPRPFITPSMLFVGDVSGKAEEASDFYISIFKNSKRGSITRYPQGMDPEKEGTIMFTDFQLDNQWFAAMDSANSHNFKFNEALSLMVKCSDQEEIDYFWEKFSAHKEAEQCGWLKDKYGVSWQIVPTIMDEMMQNGTDEQKSRVTKAFLQMKKFNIDELERAYRGEI